MAGIELDLRFDELGTEREAAYLWANPAYACALLLATSWRQEQEVVALDDLPCHVYRAEGESHLRPCAEALLGERAVIAACDRGLIPLVAARDRGAVRVARLQSLADPPAPLGGR
jgi:type VI secretion system protein ImpC